VLTAIGYVAFTANIGLPLQRTYRISVAVPNADRLIATADVRIGGVRVGEVLTVRAVPGSAGGSPHALLDVALGDGLRRVPVDTTAQVRPASVLGLTYLELVPGTSRRTLPAGGTLPLAQPRPSSDLTDLLTIFDAGSARRFQQALAGFAAGLAGRGTAINATIESVNRLLPALAEVSTTLAGPRAQLAGFLRAYERLTAGLAPIGDRLAGVISGAAATFDALAGVRGDVAATIDATPPAEAAVTDAFRVATPALDRLATLVSDLRAPAGALPRSLRQINTTLTAGLPPLRAIPRFGGELRSALGALDRLSRDPFTTRSLRKLTDVAHAARGALSLLVPAQVHCNVISLFTSGFAGVFGTLGTGDGPSLGNLVLEDAGAQGEQFQNARPSTNVGIDPIPHENGQECEAGNEPWTGAQQLGNPPGLQSRTTRATVPPPGVPELAQRAGLMVTPEGLR
jgi:virulence factor Mce-like protein